MSSPISEKPPSEGYSCPYRKRNPAKFDGSCPDYFDCAFYSFSDMHELTAHIRGHHYRYNKVCPRCQTHFPRQSELVSHLQVDRARICEVVPEPGGGELDPEDGTLHAIPTCSDTWEELWTRLFGEDDRPKSPKFKDPWHRDGNS